MTQYNEPSFPGIFRESEFQDQKTILKKILQVLSDWQFSIKSILDHGISFDDNVDVSRVSIASHGTAGTEFAVTHGLGKAPSGYFVAGQTAAGSVYDGSTANDKTTLYLKSDVSAVTFRLIIF